MSIPMMCDCGARFEAEDFLAGQEVPCPECRLPLKLPVLDNVPPQTSLLALSSLVLAVVGAFTLVGSVLAVGLAAAALWRNRREPGHPGNTLAYAAAVVGLISVPVTLSFLLMGSRVPVAGWLRRSILAAQLDPSARTAASGDGVCRLPVPEGWGKLRTAHGADPAVDGLQEKLEFLLVHLRRRVYLDCLLDDVNTPPKVSEYEYQVASSLLGTRDPDETAGFGRRAPPVMPEARESRPLPDAEMFKGHEWTFDVRRGGREWRFLVRAYREYQAGKRITPTVYVLRAYAPREDFVEAEKEIRQALDGAKFGS